MQLDATYQDKHYVFMLIEAVMGGDLRRYILKQPNRRIPENHARFYVACVIQALEFMHSLGYVHRDLKTENLLITPSGCGPNPPLFPGCVQVSYIGSTRPACKRYIRIDIYRHFQSTVYLLNSSNRIRLAVPTQP